MSFVLPEILSVGFFDMSLRYPNQKTTPERITDSFEIEIPVKEGGHVYLDKNCYDISAHKIICVKPGVVRHTSKCFTCYYIHISLEKGDLYNILINLPDFIEIQSPETYYDIYVNMIKAFNSTKLQNNILLYSEVLRLINMLCKTSSKTEQTQKGSSEAVVSALEYLNDNYLSDITLKDIAEYVHLSPIYFRNLFVNEMGISPHTYILNKRIEKSKKLLALNYSSMSDVAQSCGFSSQSYFNYVFKKVVGITPKQFKIENNNLYFQKTSSDMTGK